MSFTEDCEIWLSRRGIDTRSMTNKEIRDLYREINGLDGDW